MIKKLFKKINIRKKSGLILAVIIVGLFLFLPNSGLAQSYTDTNFGGGLAGTALAIIANIILGIIKFLGASVLIPLINLMVNIIQYNTFLDSYAVQIGWPLVRDIANMFFVVIFLVIAFSTILNISSYHYKSTLFKLIMMALLINFSKLITGFLIDFAQVIMLTFVNAFRNAAVSAMANAFGLTDILRIETTNSTDVIDNWEIFASLLMGLVFLITACGTMLAYVAVLLYRIISLWVLVMLSPLAFFMSSFGGLKKYSSEYWSKFFQQLTVGVILAFFLWLSFQILAMGFATGQKNIATQLNLTQQTSEGVKSWDRFYTFIVAIALLLLALQYAQQAGGFAGKFAGQVSGKLSDLATGKAGPTPMRWVRERYQAYKGMKEAERKERVAKFGAGILKTDAFLRKNLIARPLSAPGKAIRGFIDQKFKAGSEKAKGLRAEADKLRAGAQTAKEQASTPGDAVIQTVIQNIKNQAIAAVNDADTGKSAKLNEQAAALEAFLQNKPGAETRVQEIIAENKIKAKTLEEDGRLEESKALFAEADMLDRSVTDIKLQKADPEKYAKDKQNAAKQADEDEQHAKALEAEAIKAESVSVPWLMGSKHYWDKKAEVTNSQASKLMARSKTPEEKAEAEQLANRAKWYKRAAKGVGVGQMVGAGMLAAIPGVSVIGQGMLAAKGAGFLGKRQEERAANYADRAQSYKYQEAMKSKDNMKNLDVEEVRKIANDLTATAFDRMGAMLLLMEKGIYDDIEVHKVETELTNLGADKKIMSHYGAIVDAKYPFLSKSSTFNLDPQTGQNFTDPDKKIAHMVELVKSGVIDPTKLESSGFLSHNGEMAHVAALGMNSSGYASFIKSNSKKRALIGKGLGNYLNYRYVDNGEYDDSNIDKMAQDDPDKLDDHIKLVVRHFMAARDKSDYGKIFKMQDDGTLKNKRVFEEVLKTKDGAEVIPRVAIRDLSNQQKSKFFEYTTRYADAGVINEALTVGSEGKLYMRQNMKDYLGWIADQGSKLGRPESAFSKGDSAIDNLKKMIGSLQKTLNSPASRLNRSYDLSPFSKLPDMRVHIKLTMDQNGDEEEVEQDYGKKTSKKVKLDTNATNENFKNAREEEKKRKQEEK